MAGFDWNDARMLLAVARHGGALTASRHLKTSQTTVMRRIAALETALRLPLVERRQSGYRLTKEAQEMLAEFEALEAAALRIGSLAEARRRGAVGVIRLATHEVIANFILPSALKEFRAKYPDVVVEVLTSDRQADLLEGEADVAIRSGPRPSQPGLVSRLLGEGEWAVFAGQAYVDEHGRPSSAEALDGHTFIGGDGAWGAAVDAWLAAFAPRAKVQFRNSSVLGVLSQARQGLGLAFLPYELMTHEPALVWCFTPQQEKSRTWLVTTEALRNTVRVRAFLDFVVAYNNATKLRAASKLS
jgi:molybdate transport repressor ModE-like protein